MTLDHAVLTSYLEKAEPGMAGESTAIGDALGAATNRLKDIQSPGRIIILLTDGANAAGSLDPDDAARAAKALGIRVYTIGVGTNKPVPVPTKYGIQMHRVTIDEAQLQRIADITKGKAFRADSSETLAKVYQTIDQLEKTKRETEVYHLYDEKFAWFLWPGLLLLLCEILFNLSPWRRVP